MRRFLEFGWLAALLAFAAAAVAATLEPAVQPGGDIPANFHPRYVPPPQAQLPSAFPLPPLSTYLYTRRDAMIPMRDGARLYTVLIIPKGVTRAPIILDRTPYSAAGQTELGIGPWPENILAPLFAELVRAGYIVALQDVRGKYKSEGDYVMNRPLRGPLNPTEVDHSTDAWDSIDWLIRNVPESNGRVGTLGISYDGFTALMSLVNPHPALKAVVPMNPMVDVWKGDDWFHNGAFRQEMISYVYGQTAARNSSEEWFKSGGDDYRAFLAAGSAGAYGKALGMGQLPFWRRLTEHPDYDEYWQDQAVDRILARQPLTVPALFVGSLWDQEDIYGAGAVFDAVKRSDNGNAHLVLGPWYHGEEAGPAMLLGPLRFGSDTGHWFRANVLIPFLDRNLKGSGGKDVARVTAFDAGPNRWRTLNDWPQACRSGCAASLTAVHFAPGRTLEFGEPTRTGSDAYLSDPARPVPYRAQSGISPWAPGSSWRFWLVDNQRFASARPDVVTYTGQVLDKPLKLAGRPLVHLVGSTSGTDSDWIVKLIDIYPRVVSGRPDLDNYQLPIAMDVMRGRYHADPSHPQPLPANQPVTYEFALPNVSYTLPPGHRLMVQVQSSWFPLYDRNPQTFVPNIFFAQRSAYRRATQRLFYGPSGSWIGLPIVAPD